MEKNGKKKRGTRKPRNEKREESSIRKIVMSYGLMVMYDVLIKEDDSFAFLAGRTFCVGYNAGKFFELFKNGVSDEEYEKDMIPMLLEGMLEITKESIEDAYKLYVLRWALKKGREIWFRVHDDNKKVGILINSSLIEADKKEILPRTDPAFQHTEKSEEEQADELIELYSSMEHLLTPFMEKSQDSVPDLKDFYRKEKQSCVILFMYGRMAGNKTKINFNTYDIFNKEHEKDLEFYLAYFKNQPIPDKKVQELVKDKLKEAFTFWCIGLLCEYKALTNGLADSKIFAPLERIQSKDEELAATKQV